MKQSFHPNQGVYTSKQSPYTNFGGTTILKAGKYGLDEFISYISFDLSSIDKNSNIISAKLKLYSVDKIGFGDLDLIVSILEENFIDTNITYQDIIIKYQLDTIDISDLSMLEIDLRKNVQEAITYYQDINFGLSFKASDTSSGIVTFANIGYSNTSLYPVLEIEYEKSAIDKSLITFDNNFLITTSTSKVDDQKIATTFATMSALNQNNIALGIVMIKYLYLSDEVARGKVFLENKELEDFYIGYPEQAINIFPILGYGMQIGKGIATTLAARDSAEFLVFSQIEPTIYGFINGTQDEGSGNTIITNSSNQYFDMTGILSVNSSDDYFTNAYFTSKYVFSGFNQPKFNYEDISTLAQQEADVTVDNYGIVTVPVIGTPKFLTKSRTIKLTPAEMFNLTNAYLNLNVVVEINSNMPAILANNSPSVMANVTTNNNVYESDSNELKLSSTFSSSVSGTNSSILNDILLLSNKELDGLQVSVYQQIGTNEETQLVQNKSLSGQNIFLSELLQQGKSLSTITSLSGSIVKYRFVFTTMNNDDYELRFLSYARVPSGSDTITDKLLYQSPIIPVRLEI